MQKTRLGLSVGVLGAAVYLLGLFEGYLPVLLLAGYILLFENNGWLRRCAVKAIVLMCAFSFLNIIIGLIPDLLSTVGYIAAAFGGAFQLSAVSYLISAILRMISMMEKLLFVVLGYKALKQRTVVMPSVEKFISDHMV